MHDNDGNEEKNIIRYEIIINRIIIKRKKEKIIMRCWKQQQVEKQCNWLFEDGSDKEKECKEETSARNQLIKGLRNACAMYEKLKEDSIVTEIMREVLVENLKIELCCIAHKGQEECCLDFKETQNKMMFWMWERNILKEERCVLKEARQKWN